MPPQAPVINSSVGIIESCQIETQSFSRTILRETMTPIEVPSSDRAKALAKTRLIRKEGSERAFSEILRAAADWPCFYKPHFIEPARVFYRELEDGTHFDDSFAIVRGDKMHLIVECNVIDGTLGRFGGPLELRFSPASSFHEMRYDTIQAFSELQRLAKARNASKILLRTSSVNDPSGIAASRALASNAIPHVETRAEIDLVMDEDEILQDMRTSHRQQLRWGRENLEINPVTSACPDRAKFDRYRLFHAEIAGRVTRSLAGWEIMFSWIQEGAGELLIGMRGDDLLAGNLTLDAMETSYYLSGVYDRAHFKNPIGHFPVYSMIVRAKKRGMRFFDVGVIHAPNEDVSEKERAIGHFKHGFTSRTVSSTIWTIRI